MTQERAPTRRDRQAAQTRSEIVAAARRLFAEQGYAKTSVAQIAEAAGVSVQTIYDSLGSKAAIVRSLNDVIDQEGGVAQIAAQLFAATDPVEIIRLASSITRIICDRCGDIARLMSSLARNEPELEAVYAEGMRRHREGIARSVDRLAAMKALRKGVTKAHASEVLAALTEPQSVFVFIDGYGWTFDRWHRWVVDLLRRELLDEGS